MDPNQPLTEVQTRIHVHFILFTLVVYDHLITLHREVRSVWLHKRAKGSIIFLANRYALLALVVVLFVKDHTPSVQNCAVLERVYDASILMLCFSTCIFSAWRASAICNRSTFVFVLVLTLMGTSFVAYWVLFMTSARTHIFIVETHTIWCQAVSYISSSNLRKSVIIPLPTYIATRTCVILGETLVVLLTWAHTYRNSVQLHKMNFKVGRSSVTEYFLRDGECFLAGALLALNLTMLLVKNTTLVTSILHTYVTTPKSPLSPSLPQRILKLKTPTD
ncbi:hypothetical protein BDY19DRAFT_930139 [Irpex rosettiformis]|uniref:Uncharacterized protein n=1 Tax=Irpex rosettiformis TaxID=378272 RepID=A0ACB8UAW9_9APHY|nr:hypothetical protein BDY19DRAFT_930139 [Irpex rosettiformis]